MTKKIILVVSLVLFAFSFSYSQSKSLDEYKYVIVPNTFDFFTEADKYQLNSLTKFLFNKYGFIAIMEDEPLPQEVINDICLALYADVIKKPVFMKTKLQIELVNCRKELIFVSKEGASKEKQHKVAYNIALREAFESVKDLNHKYDSQYHNAEFPNAKESSAVISVPINNSDISEPINSSFDERLLYAQPIDNGYQLVDDTPKVIYTLIFTGKKDFYMVKGKDATVYKLNDNWVIAETVGDDLQVKTLDIKF